ncbi:Gfo/Idh/MocA family protein [Modestobacter sp. VKM Ac-2982]|uniref:Gfo/Idh/MocA family protein n=2 Tax=unclassified Modestobacter TaxID=2643866 RepID=UPI0022AA1802|nr:MULTISPECIES: Gfo/Idh/MocA family oxidoreductase [unclassified Modestobacter]MCZ2826954.1 Gfo/Idh/MocA family oxidoreductase [Modestobacter sp. VKM Ac-2981]MCZ2855350.1 Gfo/Idh/MocA family oxidoreductase [Modestobacter sp. VKM Ac-2982]
MSSDATRRPLIGVGVVGLSATGGWGAGAHLPALSTVGGFELRGLVGSSPASARAASAVHGVPAYASAGALAEADDIDLVVVTVKTPQHRDLVLPALGAGKAVFCEWPFAVDLREAEDMAAAAQGIPTFVGLQGRSSPTFRWLADLVSNGFVGEVLSVTISTAATEWGTPVSERMLYTLDRQLGATMMAIAFGHAIDSVSMVVGELQDVVATTAIRHPHVPLIHGGRDVPMTAEDQIAISGTLPGGAVLSAHQRGGIASGAGFSMTVDGSDGTLQATAPNHPHVTPVTVRGARGHGRPTEMPLPDGYDQYPRLARSPIHTLAHAYGGIRDQLLGGAAVVPDFDDAVIRHQLLDAITRSAASGRRVHR